MNAWLENSRETDRKRALMARCLQRALDGKLHAALDQWHSAVAGVFRLRLLMQVCAAGAPTCTDTLR